MFSPQQCVLIRSLTQRVLVQTEDVWWEKKTMHFLSTVGEGGLVFTVRWKVGTIIFENRFLSVAIWYNLWNKTVTFQLIQANTFGFLSFM